MNPTLQTNINIKTGIRYGVVQNNSIEGEAFHELWQNAEACSIIELRENIREKLTGLLKDYLEPQTLQQHIDCVITDTLNLVYEATEGQEEQTLYGEHEGMKYFIYESTTMIIDSPTTGSFSLCSPCYPNACDIDSPDAEGGYEGYTLPADYFYTEV